MNQNEVSLKKRLIHSKKELWRIGHILAQHLPSESIIYFSGTVGSGKTELIKAILQEWDYPQTTSPTYTLVNIYQTSTRTVVHSDLYRLKYPIEIESLNLYEYIENAYTILIEWPDNFIKVLPKPDLHISLVNAKNMRTCTMQAISQKGKKVHV